MELLNVFFLVLLWTRLGGVTNDPLPQSTQSPLQDEIEVGAVDNSSNTDTTTTRTNANNQDFLQNISIQDLSSFEINGNGKIINEINKFPRNFANNIRPLILDTSYFDFPKQEIKYDMNKGYIIYHNVSVSQPYDYQNERRDQFFISTGCNSPSMAKIRVGLPSNIKISANFTLTHPQFETIKEGGISIVIRNGSILKQFSRTASASFYGLNSHQYEDTFTQISFTNSEVDIDFDGPQQLIYNKLEKFFDEIETALKEFFVQQLNLKMKQDTDLNTYLLLDCSDIQFTKSDEIEFYDREYFLRNLYVIPEVKMETWREIFLSTGPVAIYGFSINSTEFVISRKFKPNYGSYQYQVMSRIKTGKLRGKFHWDYNLGNQGGDNSSSILYFSIDTIRFEIDYFTSNMDVYIGEIRIEPTSANPDLAEVKFAKFVLSEYLKSAIAESLKTSWYKIVDISSTSSRAEHIIDIIIRAIN